MQFKKVDGPTLRASKISDTGAIYYVYWLDDRGDQYVQIVENFGGSGSSVGSFLLDLYPVDMLGDDKHPRGYNLDTGSFRITSNNNMDAFLRAIKIDIGKRSGGKSVSEV